MENTTGVVVTSGYGALRQLHGEPFPKVLETVGSPIVVRVVQTVLNAGISRVVVVVNPLFETAIRKCLSRYFGDRLQFAIQPDRFGAADAVGRALPLIGSKNVLTVFADMPLWQAETLKQLIACYRREQPLIAMTTIHLETGSPQELERYGRIIYKDDLIQRVVEPADANEEELASRVVNPCLFVFPRLWLEAQIPNILPKEKGDDRPPERYMPPLVEIATKQGGRVIESILPAYDHWQALGVNTVDELVLANMLARQRRLL